MNNSTEQRVVTFPELGIDIARVVHVMQIGIDRLHEDRVLFQTEVDHAVMRADPFAVKANERLRDEFARYCQEGEAIVAKLVIMSDGPVRLALVTTSDPESVIETRALVEWEKDQA